MDPAKKTFPLHDIFPHAVFHGTAVPHFTPPERSAALETGFNPRSSDIVIGSYAKSGTTWLQKMIYELLDCPNGPIESFFHQIPWLQVVPPMGLTLEQIEAMNSPRLFKTHDYWNWLPDRMKESSCRFIYCYRNPKDVAVSYWHHIKTLRFTYGDKAADFPFPKYFDEIFSDENVCEYGLWENNVMDWLKNANKDNVLFLTYEDLSENTERELRKIASFLGLDVTDEHVAKVLNASSFSTMKNDPKFNAKAKTGNNGDFIRKGKVGNWQEHLTEEQSKILDGKIEMVRTAGGYIRCTL